MLSIILLGGVTLLILGLIAAVVLLLVQQHRQRRHLESLQGQLAVFVDTSINVARCVDRLALGKVENPRTVSSRRWLVEEARQRVSNGIPVDEAANTLGLHRDEVQLLRAGA